MTRRTERNYWSRYNLSRRRLLRGSSVGAVGLAGAWLVGCGGDDDDDSGNGATSPAGTSGAGSQTPSASSTAGGAGSPRTGGTLRLAHPYPEGALTLDPHTQESDGSQRSIRPIYSNLIKYIEHTGPGERELVGELAESWERPDDLTVTFKLNQGVQFQDLPPVGGRELTADDIVYSFERMVTDDPRFVLRTAYAAITKVEAVDQYTVSFTTAEPYAPLLHSLANPWSSIVAREVVEDGDIENAPVGTGPFQLVEYNRGATLRYARHPNYFKSGLPYIDEFETPIMPDPSARLAAFRSGELAIEGLRPEQEAELTRTNPDVAIHKVAGVSGSVIRFNCADPIFENPQVRQAIAAATNVDDYIAILSGGEGLRHGPMPLSIPQWALDESELPAYDPEKAKQLLSAAGYEDGFDIVSSATAPYLSVELTEIMVSQLAQVGIRVTIDVLDNAAWIDKSYRASDFSFSTYSDYAYSDPDRGLRDHYHSEGGSNNHNFGDPEIDALLDQQRGMFEAEERREVVLNAQRLIVEGSPRVWIYNLLGRTAVQPWLMNYHPMVTEAGNTQQEYEQYWLDNI